MPKASSLEVELKNNFPQADISLISSGGGVFEISLNGDLIFSKKALNRFPDGGEIKKLIMDDKSNLKQKFIEIAEEKISTQVWSIYNNGAELLIGSNFGLGKIDNDQLEDYAVRRKISTELAKKWLNPIL